MGNDSVKMAQICSRQNNSNDFIRMREMYLWRSDARYNRYLPRVVINKNRCNQKAFQQILLQKNPDSTHQAPIIQFQEYLGNITSCRGLLQIEETILLLKSLIKGHLQIFSKIGFSIVNQRGCFITAQGEIRVWINSNYFLNEPQSVAKPQFSLERLQRQSQKISPTFIQQSKDQNADLQQLNSIPAILQKIVRLCKQLTVFQDRNIQYYFFQQLQKCTTLSKLQHQKAPQNVQNFISNFAHLHKIKVITHFENFCLERIFKSKKQSLRKSSVDKPLATKESARTKYTQLAQSSQRYYKDNSRIQQYPIHSARQNSQQYKKTIEDQSICLSERKRQKIRKICGTQELKGGKTANIQAQILEAQNKQYWRYRQQKKSSKSLTESQKSSNLQIIDFHDHEKENNVQKNRPKSIHLKQAHQFSINLLSIAERREKVYSKQVSQKNDNSSSKSIKKKTSLKKGNTITEKPSPRKQCAKKLTSIMVNELQQISFKSQSDCRTGKQNVSSNLGAWTSQYSEIQNIKSSNKSDHVQQADFKILPKKSKNIREQIQSKKLFQKNMNFNFMKHSVDNKAKQGQSQSYFKLESEEIQRQKIRMSEKPATARKCYTPLTDAYINQAERTLTHRTVTKLITESDMDNLQTSFGTIQSEDPTSSMIQYCGVLNKMGRSATVEKIEPAHQRRGAPDIQKRMSQDFGGYH